MFRFIFRFLALLLFTIIFGCGGGGSPAPAPPRTVTVQIASTAATAIESLQFDLVNSGTGTAIYVANSATVVTPPSPSIDANQAGNRTRMAYINVPGISNPVIQAQFQVSGSVLFDVDPTSVEAIAGSASVPVTFVVTP